MCQSGPMGHTYGGSSTLQVGWSQKIIGLGIDAGRRHLARFRRVERGSTKARDRDVGRPSIPTCIYLGR